MAEQNNTQQNSQQNSTQQQNQNNQQNQQQNSQQSNQTTTPTWEKFLEGQPDEVKNLYGQHHTALQNSIKATRDERDDVKRQLTELLPKAEKGSDLEKQLTDALKNLENTEKRANFAEQAIKPEIGCRNVKAAFALAKTNDLFKKNGDPDWDAIKKDAPELFGALIPEGNSGNGTENKTLSNADFNDVLRRKASS